MDGGGLSDCDPIIYMNSTGRTKFINVNAPFNPGMPAFPCGLVAKSYFNDTYKLDFKN